VPDPAALAESVKAWEAADELQPPDEQTAWVYVTRGLIGEGLAETSPDETWDALWEALGFYHHSVVLDDRRSMPLTCIARVLNDLGLFASALEANSRAIELDPNDVNAWDWYIASLVNTAQYDLAEAELEGRRRKGLDTSGAVEFAAYLAAMHGEGGESPEALVEGDDPPIGGLLLRAYCRRRSGDPEGGREDYQAVVDRYRPGVASQASEYGYAEYALGDLDRAREILAPALKDERDQNPSAWLTAALCALSSGDHAEAVRLADKGVARCHGARDLDDFVADLAELERGRPASEVAQTVAVIHAAIDERRRLLETRTPQEEIEAVIASVTPEAGGPAFVWGSRALLARLAQRAGRWAEAVAAVPGFGPAPARRRAEGVHHTLMKLRDEALLLRAAEPAKGAELLEKGCALADRHLPAGAPAIVSLCAAAGATHLALEDTDGAHASFRAAGEAARTGRHDGTALGAAAAGGVGHLGDLWKLDEEFELLANDAPELAEIWQGARASITAELDSRFVLSEPPYTVPETRSRAGRALGCPRAASPPPPSASSCGRSRSHTSSAPSRPCFAPTSRASSRSTSSRRCWTTGAWIRPRPTQWPTPSPRGAVRGVSPASCGHSSPAGCRSRRGRACSTRCSTSTSRRRTLARP
jgi:tetratricopeptide (TPR) repeat protein